MSPRDGLTEIISCHVTAPPHRQSVPLQIRDRSGDHRFMSLQMYHLCCELSSAGKARCHPWRVDKLLAGSRQVPCRPALGTSQGSSTPSHPLRSSQLREVPPQDLSYFEQGLLSPRRSGQLQTQPCTQGDESQILRSISGRCWSKDRLSLLFLLISSADILIHNPMHDQFPPAP